MSVILLLTIHYTNYYYYYYYYMAKSISAPFTVAQTLNLNSTTAAVTDAVDLAAYVDPADRQGVEVLAVDFIFHNGSTLLPITSASDFATAVQVKDNSAGDLITYDNLHLTASAGFVNDGNAGQYMAADIYPDVLQRGTGGRIVVNDALEIVGKSSASIANLSITARITMRVVKLTQKDYMALALTTVADN